MAYFDPDRAIFAVLAADVNEINPEESAFFYMNRAAHEQFGTGLEGKKRGLLWIPAHKHLINPQ